jgi:L-amino acid N-acyltransferase YncA
MDAVIDCMCEDDWPEVVAIYEQAIAERQATFETCAPSWEGWAAAHCAECRLVARVGGEIVGWAAISPVSRRQCYRGVAEVSVYVRQSARGRGVGAALLERLIVESEAHGYWTLQGATFPENTASLRLQASGGFRVVGRRERIARLDGVWRDTVLTERRSGQVGNE